MEHLSSTLNKNVVVKWEKQDWDDWKINDNKFTLSCSIGEDPFLEISLKEGIFTSFLVDGDSPRALDLPVKDVLSFHSWFEHLCHDDQLIKAIKKSCGLQ
jgi:hypothetical protein